MLPAKNSSQNRQNEPAPVNGEIGYVLNSRNYLVYIDGLPTIRVNDLVVSEQGIKGVVNTLLPNQVEVLLLDEGTIYPGQIFKPTGQRLSVQAGNFLIGRAINPLGVPIDGKGMLSRKPTDPIIELEQPAKGIAEREFIKDQLITGITLIDNLVPLGKGQRELIIGDGHSGISNFLVNLIVNLRASNVLCVYACIGKPATFIKNLINTLQINKALENTIIVASSSTEPTPLIYLTPHSALTIAEYFQKQGKDVLVILDDMGIHAKMYREIALLAGKSPGRESYPGDIFYQHAHLMERAGNFNASAGGGSISALPIIELNLIDFTGFIPTNIMSITDGHLLFKSNLYNKNQRPAIDIPLSVSRVGRQTQTMISNLLSRRVRQVLAQAAELETLSRFSAELPEATQLILRQQQIIEEINKQDDLIYLPLEIQAILFGLVFTTFLHDKNDLFIRKHKNAIVKAFETDPQLSKVTQTALTLKNDDQLIQLLEQTGPKLQEICK